jgi:L-fuconolactonase
MVTEANWETWTPDGLKQYFDRVLELFGPARLMVGTDWPVLTVAETYLGWWKVIEGWLQPLSVDDRRLVEGEVAARVYKLDVDSQAKRETT